MHMKRWLAICVPLLAIALMGSPQSVSAAGKVPVFVSILPQKYFVEKVGGNLVEVNVMVLPGASPHTFEPKPRQMVAIAKAKLYFAIGVEFERIWLAKIAASNPAMKIVATDQGIEKIAMLDHHHEDEVAEAGDAQKEAEHDHESGEAAIDPHIWLSPVLVMQQARTILEALQQIDPQNHAQYQAGYQRFSEELKLLDQELKQLLTGRANLPFIVFHPSWGYFAKEYHLRQIPIELEGKSPKPAQLQELIGFAKKEAVRVIFAQPQFSSRTAEIVAKEIKGEVILIDPLAEDWGANMRTVAGKLKTALRN